MPSAPPPAGRPVRVAFVGSAELLRAATRVGDGSRIRPVEVPTDGGADVRDAVERAHPHAVVVLHEPAVVSGIDAPVLAYGTEAVGADRVVGPPGTAGLWRSAPLPVSDDLFAPVTPLRGRPRALVIGGRAARRDVLLSNAREHHGALLTEVGAAGADVDALLRAHEVGINLHEHGSADFEHAVLLHLAAGHLLLSEPLTPTHGLERDIDFLEVSTPGSVAWTLEQLRRFPTAWHRVRVRGRLKAEQFRASHVWPRLVGDLLADVAAFGSRAS